MEEFCSIQEGQIEVNFLGEDRSKEYEDRQKWKNCKLCKVKIPDHVDDQIHLRGKRHKRLARHIKNKSEELLGAGSEIGSVTLIAKNVHSGKKKPAVCFFPPSSSFEQLLEFAKEYDVRFPRQIQKKVLKVMPCRKLAPPCYIPGAFRLAMIPDGLYSTEGRVMGIDDIFTKLENEIENVEELRRELRKKESDDRRSQRSVNVEQLEGLRDQTKRHNYQGLKAGGDIGELDETEVQIQSDKPISQSIICKISKGKFKDQDVVVKEFVSALSLRDKKKMRQEAKRLVSLKHPNVVQFFGILTQRCAIVMEYLEKQLIVENEEIRVHDVRGLLDNVEDDFDWDVRRQIAFDSANALAYLHNQGIIHYDVKAANFLLGGGCTSNYIVKLGDLGESVQLYKTKTAATRSLQLTGDTKMEKRKVAGTLPFIAPELYIGGTKPSFKSDVYSFSMYLLELMFPIRVHPWADDCHFPDLIPTFVKEGKRPSLPEPAVKDSDKSTVFRDVIFSCWETDVNKRPDMDAVIQHLSINKENHEYNNEKGKEQHASNFCFKEWLKQTRDIDVTLIQLEKHQSSTIDVAGEIAGNFAANGGDKDFLPKDLAKDLEEAVQRLDGTNACQYLSASYADLMLHKGLSVLKADLKETVESMLVSIPQKINSIRDINQQVFLEDAIAVLAATGVVTNKYDKLEELLRNQCTISDESGICNLEEAVLRLITSNTSSAAVYTCTPISMAMYSLVSDGKCYLVLIDTHSVPQNVGGKNTGIIVLITYNKGHSMGAVNKLTMWMKERILSACPKGALQSLLQMKLTEKGIDDENVWDITDDQLLSFDFTVPNDAASASPCTSSKCTVDDQHLSVSEESLQQSSENQVDPEGIKESTLNTDAEKYFEIPENLPPAEKKDELLWKGCLTTFGYSCFKPFQLQAIQAIEKGSDAVVIQPTGMGKSICFQVPALLDSNKTSIVISPTLSLIRSQTSDLKKKGIDVIPLGRSAGEDKARNQNRLFGQSEDGNPALAYTTPEHFVQILPLLKEKEKEIKMFVFDEVHKAFDRQSCFRESYNSLETIKSEFPNVPIMALTATLPENNLKVLCKEYLRKPVLIKGTVDRKNIKLSVARYKTKQKSKLDNGSSEDVWTSVCEDISKFISGAYSIIYMDFTNEVKDLSLCLSKQEHLHDQVRCYYGKGMTDSRKAQIVDDFNSEKFQVLCATESYEVGVHNPHVDVVGRIGCMRNMNVLLQEIGRAGRSGNAGCLGIVFFNENKDDQRLGHWLKGCCEMEKKRIKDEYSDSWKWIYSIYTGQCFRKGIVNYYNENVGDQAQELNPEDCCLCCELNVKQDFNISQPLVLLLKAIKELEEAFQTVGVSESKIIPWLRGAKQDWLAKDGIQNCMDNSKTYSKGRELDGNQLSARTWEAILRQGIQLGYVDMRFNTFDLKGNGKSIVRTYRSYTTTAKGASYIENSSAVLVMSPHVDLLSSTNVQKAKSSKRKKQTSHYLPKIKDLLGNSSSWTILQKKEQYEFPGYGFSEGLYFCRNYATTPFASKSRIHFIDDDNQLTKSSSQTQIHEVIIDGIKTKVNIKRSGCEGVKVCSSCETYVVTNRQRVNRCVTHKRATPLKETGKCPVQFIYVWPTNDDGRRWIGTINAHNHPQPAPHKISSQVQEDIQLTALNNPRSTAKDLAKGLGMGYIPGEKSIAAVNIDRVRRERRLVMSSLLNKGKEYHTGALATIIDFDKVKYKVDQTQDPEDLPWTKKINSLMGKYQMSDNEYLFTPSHKYAFFMAPFQAKQLAQSSYIFTDVTYTGNTSFPYLLNVVSLNEITLLYNAVGRVLCNKQDSVSYAKAFNCLFEHVTKQFPDFRNGETIDVILVDFDDAEAKGLRDAIGADKANKVLRGCQVHWTRSLQRVAKLVTKSSEEQKLFLLIGNKIPYAPEKSKVLKLFHLLSGQEDLQNAEEFLPLEKRHLLTKLNNQSWKKLKSWSNWWCRESHLRMFTKAHTNLTETTWEAAPKTTNAVESINRQSIHEKGCSLYSLLENIYMEDRGHAAKLVAAETNVTLSYSSNEPLQKKKRNESRKRKRSSMGNGDDQDSNGPPDKRRNLNNGGKEKSGRNLVGTRLQVEYKEESENGMIYLGWFDGQITAFNRRQGYFVNFDGKEVDGKKIQGWSEWIDQLDSDDVRLL